MNGFVVKNGNQTLYMADITWTYIDNIDANSFQEMLAKNGFNHDLDMLTSIINYAECISDLVYDKAQGAAIPIEVSWQTSVKK